MIEYHLDQPPTSEVTLAITDEGGETIQEFSSGSQEGPEPPTSAGMNRFLWDMRYPGVDLPASAGALAAFQSVDASRPARPVATPGRYLVRLTVDGRAYEQPFEIRLDPRVTASDTDLRAQFDLMVELSDRLSQVVDTVIRIREVRTEVLGGDLPEDSQVNASGILEQLREIEGVLTIWMGSPEHPMMWGAPGLIQKMSSLLGYVGAADARPTESMVAVFEYLSERFEAQQDRLNTLIVEEVDPLLPR